MLNHEDVKTVALENIKELLSEMDDCLIDLVVENASNPQVLDGLKKMLRIADQVRFTIEGIL